MRQGKVLALGILTLIWTIGCLFSGQITFMLVFLAPTVLFLGIWFYRFQRDHSIIAEARQEREKVAHAPLSAPPMTSRGSRHLFVPPPLNTGIRKGE